MYRTILFVFLAASISVIAADSKSAPANKAKNPLPGTKAKGAEIPGYERRMIEGFQVVINKNVLEQSFDDYKKKPFTVLEEELKGVERVLAPKFVKELRAVPIWVEWDNGEVSEDGGRTVALYYGGPLMVYYRANAKTDPRKANNVEVMTLKFLTELKQKEGRDQKQVVLLHELIHAVHDKLIGMDNPEIREAYRQAKDRKLYELVEHKNGPKREAYANKNHAEYFAEITCAYLDRIDYFPYDREGLKSHDPAGYKVVEKMWGKVASKSKPEPAAKSEQKKAG